MSIADNIVQVKARIAGAAEAAGRDPGAVAGAVPPSSAEMVKETVSRRMKRKPGRICRRPVGAGSRRRICSGPPDPSSRSRSQGRAVVVC